MCQCSTARCWCWRCRGGAGVGSVRSWKGVKGKSISEYLMQLDDFLKTNQCSQTLLSHLMFWFSCVCEASLGENTQCSSPRTDQSVGVLGYLWASPKPFGDPVRPQGPDERCSPQVLRLPTETTPLGVRWRSMDGERTKELPLRREPCR